MSADQQIAPGETVADRYRINRVLGEGGMGVVYAAEHMLMRKEVALKVLHGDMCTMPEIVARFEREAIAAAAIDHPNVAGATDFGRLPDGACYLVLELLKGESLRDEIKKGPMSLERSLVIMRGIANGVAAAHAKSIVHRDLKPENVMLVERDGLADFVKVLDFGIAKMDTHAAEAAQGPGGGGQQIVTRVGTIFGTPEYMAPEQAVGDKVDARADIFALGVLWLEMLTGQCPFKGEVLNVLRERILMTQMPDMSAIESEEVRALITKMMQRHPDDRLQSAGELLQAIDALEGQPIGRISRPSFSGLGASTSPAVATANTLIAEASVTPPPAASAVPSAPAARPRWMVPAAIASAVGLVLVIIAFSASGGDDKTSKDKGAKHGASSVVAKHAPAPSAAPPPPAPEPSASAEPEPEPEPAASVAPAPSLKPTAQRPAAQPKRQPRRSGGGIYIPPPKEWFK
ncbi:MAG: serine/threonine-protein kinase [Labilithrix sp.]